MAEGVEDYLDSSMELDHHNAFFHITELTDRYVKLDNRRSNEQSGMEMIIHFDPDDEDDRKLREEVKKVYDWYMKYCGACKAGKYKPIIAYELALSATLRELLGLPFPDKKQKEPKYEAEVGDWFWKVD